MPIRPAVPRSSEHRNLLSLVATAAVVAALAPCEARAQEVPPRTTPNRAALGYPVQPPPPEPDPWVSTPSAPAASSAGDGPSTYGAPAAASANPPYGTYAPERDRVHDGEKKQKSEPSGFAFDLAAAAEMPIMMGGQATLEVPYRFLLQSEVGVMPGFSVDAVDSILVNAGAYDQTTSELVRNGLRGSVVGRFSVGWRPFVDHGFEILGGYTIASFGGGVSARQAVEAAAGTSLPAQIPDTDVVVHSTIHSLHLSLGWRWVVAEHFLIRMSLGYMQAVGSSSHVDVPDSLSQNQAVVSGVAVANQVLDAKLDDIYKTYVKLPVLGLSMGYRF